MKNKSKGGLWPSAACICFIFFFTFIFIPAPVASAAGDLTLSVIADSNNVPIGGDVKFTIQMSDASAADLCAFAFKIVLPDGLAYKPGTGSIAANFQNKTGMAIVEFDEEPFLMASGFGVNPYNGSAIDVALFTCEAIAAGQMQVTLTDVQLLNEEALEIPSAVAPAYVTVTQASVTAAPPASNDRQGQSNGSTAGAQPGGSGDNPAGDLQSQSGGASADVLQDTTGASVDYPQDTPGGNLSNTQSDRQEQSTGATSDAPPKISGQESSAAHGENVDQTQPADTSTSSPQGGQFDTNAAATNAANSANSANSADVAAWINPFADVMASDWFYDSVAWVNINSLMFGAEQTLFNPDGPMTRAMLVSVLYRHAGSPAVGGGGSPAANGGGAFAGSFADVPEGEWYAGAVAWAAAYDIAKGVSASEFSPGENITREQIAALFFRYAEHRGADVSARGDLNQFSDSNAISEYAAGAIAWAAASGIITGKPGGLLDPQAVATRAEVAAILRRYANTY